MFKIKHMYGVHSNLYNARYGGTRLVTEPTPLQDQNLDLHSADVRTQDPHAHVTQGCVFEGQPSHHYTIYDTEEDKTAIWSQRASKIKIRNRDHLATAYDTVFGAEHVSWQHEYQQFQFPTLRTHLPDFVVESASPKRNKKSGRILTESMITVCSFKLFDMNKITAFRSFSGKVSRVSESPPLKPFRAVETLLEAPLFSCCGFEIIINVSM
jgi:hypothetical protein